MSNQEEVPWWICKEGDKNFCTYVDTDSNYFHAEPLLKHLYPNFEEWTKKKKTMCLKKWLSNIKTSLQNITIH
jgi:hypothetical protein